MKNKKRIMILALSMIAVFAAAITFAYFTDQSDEVKNTFTMGNVEILLDEAPVVPTVGPSGTTWAANNAVPRVLSNTYTGIYPGAILPKDPTVKNTGTNPAYVRVKVTVNNFGSDVNPSDLWLPIGSGWVLDAVKSSGNVFYYNYTDILQSGASSSAVFTKVEIPTTFTSANMAAIGNFNILVEAHAIQAQGFANVTAAFTAYDAQ
ncbi:SipW-dependent-type signal peptide-containing protein [Proteiniclasticum ruminis]|uniref:SipW-dependent-type signal peptide-containing protein n=1 Tax=Proteiniclasticum ruminis TaxID=398199 RepID=UPI0028AE4F68|nr:SipW-dependent-type signal peptide-containing protein [Proteiniclasticum ruminis]